ncbi:hypothetical protein B0T13DRAFT_131147 [Neurospora crassa]|nr:hypothetical protein B0T13DRAFT_131147 [Neurospora crassa]
MPCYSTHRPSAAYPAGLIDATSRQTNHLDYLACDDLSLHTLSHGRHTARLAATHRRGDVILPALESGRCGMEMQMHFDLNQVNRKLDRLSSPWHPAWPVQSSLRPWPSYRSSPRSSLLLRRLQVWDSVDSLRSSPQEGHRGISLVSHIDFLPHRACGAEPSSHHPWPCRPR